MHFLIWGLLTYQNRTFNISSFWWKLSNMPPTKIPFSWWFSTKMQITRTICAKGKVTLVVFVQPFSTVCFQMCLQLICLRGCRVTLHLFVFSRLCIFKCVLNKPALKRGTCSHIGCTCLTISYFVFRMCLWIACLWGFKVTLVLSHLCTVGLQMYLYMFVFFIMCFKCFLKAPACHIGCISLTFLKCVLAPQIACLWGCKVTLAAFLSSSACFQMCHKMSSQIVCLWGC